MTGDRVKYYLAGIAGVALWSGHAVGEPLEVEPEDGVICTSIASPWHSSSNDDRSIEQVPVPQSYRARFEAVGTCSRMQLVEEDLIDWHLRFGSERSVVPALEYLAQDYLRNQPSPENYLGLLRRAARQVERQNRPIRLLEAFVETRENYVFLATQYQRAAEEFKSRTLLETADRYLGAAVDGAKLFADLESDPRELDNELDLFKTDDLELRSAVLHAQVAPSPETIARAEAVLQLKGKPYYGWLAERFEQGGDFCDLRRVDFSEELEAAKIACDEDYKLQERTVSFFVSRSMLDMADGEERWDPYGGSFESAVRLLEAERYHDSTRCCWLNSEEDLLRLHLAAADAFRRAAGQPHSGGSGSNLFRQALRQLQTAESFARPDEAPARFRRIAESWLNVFGQLEEATEREERGSVRSGEPKLARHAAYLTHTLANLDAIARGAD